MRAKLIWPTIRDTIWTLSAWPPLSPVRADLPDLPYLTQSEPCLPGLRFPRWELIYLTYHTWHNLFFGLFWCTEGHFRCSLYSIWVWHNLNLVCLVSVVSGESWPTKPDNLDLVCLVSAVFGESWPNLTYHTWHNLNFVRLASTVPGKSWPTWPSIPDTTWNVSAWSPSSLVRAN